MKRFIISFGILVGLVFVVSSHSFSQSSLSVGGIYNVKGTNPGGGSAYRGTASITKQGDQYLIHWQVGTVYDGVGTLKGNTFTVEWGTPTQHVGTVTYVVEADGGMKGTWYTAKDPGNLGTEILTPKK